MLGNQKLVIGIYLDAINQVTVHAHATTELEEYAAMKGLLAFVESLPPHIAQRIKTWKAPLSAYEQLRRDFEDRPIMRIPEDQLLNTVKASPAASSSAQDDLSGSPPGSASSAGSSPDRSLPDV